MREKHPLRRRVRNSLRSILGTPDRRKQRAGRRPIFEPLEERQMLSCGGAFSINSVSVYESEGSAVLAVTLSGASCGEGETASVSYSTTDGTATIAGSDYTSTGGTLSFTSNGSQSVSVPIATDGLTESDEDFSVVLSSPTNATIASGSTTGTVTIHDNGPDLWISDIQVAEEDTAAILTIQVSQSSSVAITGNWSTSDGSAEASNDYTAVSGGSFTIPASSTSVQIQVTIIDDEPDEWDETFYVTLSNIANAIAIDSEATATIVDDDGTAPQLFAGRTSDADSGIEEGCPVCAGDDLFVSWAEAYDGNYNVYSDYLWGSSLRGPSPGSPPSNACEAAQDTGQAANLFESGELPQYQVASSGLTYIETRVTIPEDEPATVADQYSVLVKLTSSTGTDTTLSEVFFDTDGAGLTVGDEIVLAVQVDAEALGLATGYYKTTSVITAHFTSDTRSETQTGATIIVNRHGSPYGDLWWIPDLDRLLLYDTSTAVGAALVRGDGTTAWFGKSGGTYTNQTDGSFSSLVEETEGETTEYVLTTRYNEKFRFDEDGYLIAHYGPQGTGTTFTNDGDQLDTITDPFGRVTQYFYDSQTGSIDYIENDFGQTIDFTVDSQTNDLVAVTLDEPGVGSEAAPTYTLDYYDASSELYDGFLESISFDMTRSLDAVSTETSALTLSYSDLGQVSGAENADTEDWSLTTVQSVALAYVVAGTGSSGNPADVVKASDLKAVKTNERGYATTFTTDRFGNVTSITDALQNTTTIERNSDGQITKVTEPDPDGQVGGLEPAVTEFIYLSESEGGHLTVILYPDGSARSFDYYDATFGIARHITDELGRETRLTVDAAGLITTIDQVVGGSYGDSDDVITTFEYSDGETVYPTLPVGMLVSITDPEGVETRYDYFTDSGRFGWLEEITYNDGGATEADRIVNAFDYDAQGNLTSFTDGEGRVTAYEYDDLNQLRKVFGPYPSSDPGGLRTIDDDYLFDPGDPYEEPSGTWSLYTGVGYDSDERRAAATEDPGAVATWTFDNLVPGMTYEVAVTWSAVDASQQSLNGADDSPFSVYDGTTLGDLLAVIPVDQSEAPPEHPIYTNPSAWRIIGQFTPQVTDTLTVVLESENAELGMYVLADAVRINAAALEVTYECNEQGGALSETDAKGRVTEYGYDALMRLGEIKLPDPDGGAEPSYVAYSYDAVGNLTAVVSPDPDGDGPLHAPVTEYTYDELDRVKTVLSAYPDPIGGTIIDDDSTDPDEFETSAGWTTVGSGGYEDDGYLWADDTGGEWADYKFTGLVPGKSYEVLATWVADETNNASEVQYTVYDGPAPSDPPAGTQFLVQPDIVDQREAPTGVETLNDPNDAEDTNGDPWHSLGVYTASGEALSVRLANDGVDGRVLADAVRIVEARAETTYEYDDAHNLTLVTDALGNDTEYAYDTRHRLVEVTEADPDGSFGELTSPITQFVYDAASQIRQTIDPLGRVVRYFYDEDLPRVAEVRYPHPIVLEDDSQLLDEDVATYVQTWVEDVAGGYGGYHSTITNDGSATATWTFDEVVPGDYEVFVTWTDDATVVNAQYDVAIDGGSPQTFIVNQLNTPADGDLFGDGFDWQSFGDFVVGPTEDEVSVTLHGKTAGTVVADAVRLMPKAPTYGYAYTESGALDEATDPLGNVTAYGYDQGQR